MQEEKFQTETLASKELAACSKFQALFPQTDKYRQTKSPKPRAEEGKQLLDCTAKKIGGEE